jgi:hypothetical protein
MQKILVSLVTILAIFTSSCKDIDKYAVLLDASYWSVQEAISVEWLSPEEGVLYDDIVNATRVFTRDGTDEQKRAAVIKSLQDALATRIPFDSRLRVYIEMVINALVAQQTKFKAS